MISLDQVTLLEEKVESAVEKIKQLEGENAALRNKCSELTNALSAKTEQLAAFENEQKTIESGIIKAIDRLNSIEHSVLKKADAIEKAVPVEEIPQVQTPSPAAEEIPAQAPAAEEEVTKEELPPTPPLSTQMNFDSMESVEEPPFEEIPNEEVIEDSIEEPLEDPIEEDNADSDPESKDQLGFDIF